MKLRIVRDYYAGYEVQWKRWYWPLWHQAPGPHYWFVNTFVLLEDAREWAKQLRTGVRKQSWEVDE